MKIQYVLNEGGGQEKCFIFQFLKQKLILNGPIFEKRDLNDVGDVIENNDVTDVIVTLYALPWLLIKQCNYSYTVSFRMKFSPLLAEMFILSKHIDSRIEMIVI